MEWYKNWLWLRSDSILPTTVHTTNQINLPGFQDGLSYIRGRFWGGLAKGDNVDDDKQSQLSSYNTERLNVGRARIGPVSYPAYLNFGSRNVWVSLPQRRKSSLLEGSEQTVELLSASKHLLVLPKADHEPNTDVISDGNSQLPVPVAPSLDFKEKGVLYGYLEDGPTRKKTNNHSTKISIVTIIIIFICAIFLLLNVYKNFPQLQEDELEKVKLPKNMEEAKELGRVLSKYKDTNYYEVTTAFFITYIFLQTFAIPGSVFLSILSGFLYPFYIALFLVCLCSGIGATGCYMISLFIGKPLVNKYLAARVQQWNNVVDGQREHLFNYLLFLRITPFLPNWFINIVSPVIHIPVSLFFFATFIGVAPLSFIAIQAGTTLYQLTTAGDAISWTGVLVMAVLAIFSILPVVFKNFLKRKFE